MGRAEISWDPSNPHDPGPCIYVTVMNSREVIEAGRSIGLEYPKPIRLRALIDTGAAVTVISKTFANFCKLFPTNDGCEIRALGTTIYGGEHAGAISFPDTNLRPFNAIRFLSANFEKEPNYACLIGRDIIENWLITFDGRHKRVVIED